MNEAKSEKFLRVNDVDICYTDSENNKKPIIFIHGFPFDKSMWNSQREYFESNYRVITYDIRGYGKSSNAGSASMEIYADDLIGIIEKLGLNRAIVCGLSMGGYILLNAVNRYPEKFEALILADTQCIADTPEGVEKRKKLIRQIEKDGLEDFAKSFVGNVFTKESIINKIESVGKIQSIILSAKSTTVTGTLNALAARAETCSILEKIKLPVLILCGKEDVVTPPVQSEFLHSKILDSELFILESAGHLSNLEQPDKFNEFIFDFIAERLV